MRGHSAAGSRLQRRWIDLLCARCAPEEPRPSRYRVLSRGSTTRSPQNAWRFAVDKNGNVGVGVDPLFRLDVLGRMRLRALGAQPAGSWFSGEADTPQLFVGQTDVMAGAPFGIMHGGSWRFLLRSDGKIGIGTTTPSELLDVAGNLKISAGGKLFFPDGTSLSTAATGGVTNVTSTDPAIVVTKSGTTSQLSLANLGIGTSKLADASITTSKLADASVTPAKF